MESDSDWEETPSWRSKIRPEILALIAHLDLSKKISSRKVFLCGGAYGDVFKGQCTMEGYGKTKVAIKRLRFYMKEDIMMLFEREIFVWSSLRHINILPLLGYAFENESDYPLLISEWMHNGSAWDYVNNNPKCNLLQIVEGIAEGLSYLHNEGVVHSDIKSDNILISKAGLPVICDFGCSRMIESSRSFARLSSGEKGTTRYIAYELVKFGGAHSMKADVWAYGMVVYELLVKKRPYYQYFRDAQVLLAIARLELPCFPHSLEPLDSKKKNALNLLQNVCHLCWAHNPTERADMEVILNRLRPDTSAPRKALSIGIQYQNAVLYSKRDPPPEIYGSHRDPERMKDILMELYGYEEEDIVILKDDGMHTLPTRENILKAIDDLVENAKAGDRFVFHFSGHGGQIPDRNDDEADELVETIWPVDIVFDENKEGTGEVDNYIVDDELKERLIDKLPAGTHLTVILDCCHSGTGVDLPNASPDNSDDEDIREIWSPTFKPLLPNLRLAMPGQGERIWLQDPLAFKKELKIARDAIEAKIKEHEAQNELPQNIGEDDLALMRDLETIEDLGSAIIRHNKSKFVNSNKYVTSWAGCFGSGVELEDTDGGMLTKAFWSILKSNRSPTHKELYKAIEKYLMETLRPAKKELQERGWDTVARPRTVLASLQKLEDIYPTPFSF